MSNITLTKVAVRVSLSNGQPYKEYVEAGS